MILKTLKTLSLDSSTGSMTIHKGDLFRSESSDVVTAGYARKLTKNEVVAVLSDYVNTLQAKELMRHTDVRTTQRYYHGDTDRLRGAVNHRGRVVHLENRSKKEAGKE